MDNDEQLIDVAAATLKSIQSISEQADTALKNARNNPAAALAQINTFNDGRAISTGVGISRGLVEGYELLVREPCLARVSVIDEDGNKKIYLFARRSTVSGIPNFSSYKAPVGRLASLDIGDQFQFPNGEEVEVIEKLILNPSRVDGIWDSTRTRVFFEDSPSSVVASLRNLLTRNSAVEEEFDPFAEYDLEHLEINEDHSRDILRGISLRDQAILDKTQDTIFRMPLETRLMLSGPPGTGKTTTLIRRLGQKLQLPEEMAEDISTIMRSRRFNDLDHKNSWLMFTPTRLLELYLREAFGKEGIPIDNSKIVTFAAFREQVSKNQFRLLRSGTGGGGFVLKPSVKHETEKAQKYLTSWFESFDAFQGKAFFNQLLEAATEISRSEQNNVRKIGERALAVLDGKGADRLSLALVELQEISESLQGWISERRLEIKSQLDKHLRLQINTERSFAVQFLRHIESLKQEDEEDLDAEDLLPDEGLFRSTSRGQQLAFSTFRKSMQAFSRSVVQKRALSPGSRNARILDWLGDRSISKDRAQDIGQELLLISLAVFLLILLINIFEVFLKDIGFLDNKILIVGTIKMVLNLLRYLSMKLMCFS